MMRVNHDAVANTSNVMIMSSHHICLDPLPGGIGTSDIEATDNLLESSRGEIKAVGAAARAAVDNLHLSGTGIASDADHAAAGSLGVEDAGIDGGNHVGLGVGSTAGSEAGGKEGRGAGLALLEGLARGREGEREESERDDLGEHDCCVVGFLGKMRNCSFVVLLYYL